MIIRTVLVTIFSVAAITLSAQNSSALKKGEKVNNSEQKSKIFVHSDYAEMEKKIIEAVKGDVIPASVPKYTQGQSIEEYRKLLRIWSENNPTLLTDDYLKKLQERKKK